MMFVYEVKSLADMSDEIEINVGIMSASSMAIATKIIEDYYNGLLISANLTYLDYSSRNMVSLDRVKEYFHLTNTADS